jgi:DNA polymerase III alpha subunit
MNNKNQEFANWYYEKHFLGYAYHTTLQSLFTFNENIRDVEAAFADERVHFVGWVDEATKGKSRNGNDFLSLMLSDEKAEMKTMIFNRKKNQCEENNNGKLPAKSDIVIVKGTKKDAVVFADTIEVADVTIYTKLSELKG